LAEARRINVEGSKALFRAAKEAGVRRQFFVSSMAAYPEARSIYGITKWEVEKAGHTLGVVSLRPGLIVGEGTGGIVGALQKVMAKAPVVPVVASESQVYLCSDGFVGDTILELLKRGDREFQELAELPIVLADPRPRRFRELVQSMARSSRRRPILVPFPSAPAIVGLTVLEGVGRLLRRKMRLWSDSLVSLVHYNKNPDFSSAERLGLVSPKVSI
jgi:nucleoside-diphosphate-sugar epimerase